MSNKNLLDFGLKKFSEISHALLSMDLYVANKYHNSVRLLSTFQTYMPCCRSLIPPGGSPSSQPLELHDDHLHDLRVELRPVALRAPAPPGIGIAAGIAVLFGLLLAAAAVVVSRLLFAALLLLFALSPPFPSALL